MRQCRRRTSAAYTPAVPAYSLDLTSPNGPTYIPWHEFPEQMDVASRFTYDGWTYEVVEVAVKNFDAAGEPDLTLRCVAA